VRPANKSQWLKKVRGTYIITSSNAVDSARFIGRGGKTSGRGGHGRSYPSMDEGHSDVLELCGDVDRADVGAVDMFSSLDEDEDAVGDGGKRSPESMAC
jgi:hypothetical protein